MCTGVASRFGPTDSRYRAITGIIFGANPFAFARLLGRTTTGKRTRRNGRRRRRTCLTSGRTSLCPAPGPAPVSPTRSLRRSVVRRLNKFAWPAAAAEGFFCRPYHLSRGSPRKQVDVIGMNGTRTDGILSLLFSVGVSAPGFRRFVTVPSSAASLSVRAERFSRARDVYVDPSVRSNLPLYPPSRLFSSIADAINDETHCDDSFPVPAPGRSGYTSFTRTRNAKKC